MTVYGDGGLPQLEILLAIDFARAIYSLGLLQIQ